MAKFIQYRTRESLYDGAFDSSSGWAAAGMGDVIVTDGGHILVVDGGHPNDAEDLLELLESRTDGGAPVVDLWIITHPHGDHFGALREIAEREELRARITVKKLVYFFPEDFLGREGVRGALAPAARKMERICELTGAESHLPERDEVFTVDGVEIRFLFVPDDCSVLNTAGSNPNSCSLIFSVRGARRRAIVTGDAYGRSMQITAWRYAEGLKCDILQMPHHALCDAYCSDFYRYTSPETLLMPTSTAGYRAMHTIYAEREGARVNAELEGKAARVILACDGTVSLDL